MKQPTVRKKVSPRPIEMCKRQELFITEDYTEEEVAAELQRRYKLEAEEDERLRAEAPHLFEKDVDSLWEGEDDWMSYST